MLAGRDQATFTAKATKLTISSSYRYVVPDSPANFKADAPETYLRESLKRMKVDQCDIYLVHGHIHARSIPSVAKSLADCVENGLTKCVGVANYSADDMLQMRDELAEYGIPLATNQGKDLLSEDFSFRYQS